MFVPNVSLFDFISTMKLRQTIAKFPTCHVRRERAVLDSIALRKHDAVIISDCVKKNSISNLHVIGMPLNEQTISFFFLPCGFTDSRLVIPKRVY